MKEETKTLPQLVKGSSIYKLVVPEKVEEKIRYLIRKFPHTEWSGILFYTHQGTFEDNNLVITCEDIYPMDLGNATYTEFSMSEDVTAYMAENIELFDCNIALVHSHHTMPTQFSGTDMQTLKIKGDDTNCFVSLIVNTEGNYSAKITRKVQTKSEITVKRLGTSYEFFGEGTKELTHDGEETTKTVDKEVIEYFDLEVERHEVSNTLSYLDDRFDEIQKKKETNRPPKVKQTYEENTDKGFFDFLHQKGAYPRESKELSMFSNETQAKKEDWTPDSKEIHKAVVHILTCNLIINPDKIDLRQWVKRHMDNVYKQIFGLESAMEKDEEMNGFVEWRDFIIQFTLDYFDYSKVPDYLMEDFDIPQSRVAEAILDELKEYLNINEYINSYYSAVSCYIIE